MRSAYHRKFFFNIKFFFELRVFHHLNQRIMPRITWDKSHHDGLALAGACPNLTQYFSLQKNQINVISASIEPLKKNFASEVKALYPLKSENHSQQS